LLATYRYKVLISCHYNQFSIESSSHPVDGDSYGLFTAAIWKINGAHPIFFKTVKHCEEFLQERRKPMVKKIKEYYWEL